MFFSSLSIKGIIKRGVGRSWRVGRLERGGKVGFDARGTCAHSVGRDNTPWARTGMKVDDPFHALASNVKMISFAPTVCER